MDELLIVSRRREEVLADMAKARSAIEVAKKVIEEGESEMLDLDVTGRTIARLVGAEWPPAGSKDAAPPPKATSGDDKRQIFQSVAGRTNTDLILSAFVKDAQLGGLGLEPKQAAEFVRGSYGIDVKNDYVSSIVWRLWNRKQLIKHAGGVYTVPDNKKVTDLLSSE